VLRTFLLLCLLPATCFAQSSATGKAETSGPCSPAVSGNNNQFKITCQGISDALGAQFVNLLNRISQKQLDPAAVMAKLDDIQKGVKAIGEEVNPNAPKITYGKNGVKRITSPGRSTVSDEAISIYNALVILYDNQNWVVLREQSEEQIKERPEWFTPYVMAAIAADKLGDKPRALELAQEADEGMANSPAYEDLPQQVHVFLEHLHKE